MIHFNYRERAFGKFVGLFILSVFILGITTTILKGIIQDGVLTGVVFATGAWFYTWSIKRGLYWWCEMTR